MRNIRLLSTIIIITFVFAETGYVTAKPANTCHAEKIAREFLYDKMQSIVSHNVDIIDRYFTDKSDSSQRYLLFTKKQLLEDYIISYASNDYAIEKVTPLVSITDAYADENTARVKATLSADIYWNAANALGSPIKAKKTERHIILLVFENGQWKIVQDLFQTKKGCSDKSSREDISKMQEQIRLLKTEAQATLQKAGKSKPTRLLPVSHKWTASGFPKSAIKTPAIFLKCSSRTDSREYNREAVYNWAYNHWNNYSGLFINFGDEDWKGGDCTNFVSQCLRAGGAMNDKTGAFQWYYDNRGTPSTSDDTYSWTWSVARGLNSILEGNYKNQEFGPKATQKVINGDNEYDSSIGNYILPGDLVQYHWKTKSTITHAAVIVGMIYNSSKSRYEPVIAEHTEDSWFTPWTNNAYKTYFVHITGIN
ncbi:MAG TPA: amidase domain-containing protein [Ruminiclostridium sp.]|nr:amidase domain-containing protein [Ruminiclostridium sp.]